MRTCNSTKEMRKPKSERYKFLFRVLLIAILTSVGYSKEPIRARQTALILQLGTYIPSMKMNADVSTNGSISGQTFHIESSNEYSGESSYVPSFGIGILSRGSSGFAYSLCYHFRLKSEMAYTKEIMSVEGQEFEFSYEDNPSEFSYYLHSLSLTFMQFFQLSRKIRYLYLGLGGRSSLLHFPDKYFDNDFILGESLHSLIGLEYLVSPKYRFFGEFRYNVGRTRENHFGWYFSDHPIYVSQNLDYFLSLSGPEFYIGVNIYSGSKSL